MVLEMGLSVQYSILVKQTVRIDLQNKAHVYSVLYIPSP